MRVSVQWSRQRQCWHVLSGNDLPSEYFVKQEAVSAAVRQCRNARAAGLVAQLTIRNKNGRVSSRRTY